MVLEDLELYYPSAREWMWNYCMYLGPYTDSKGNNFDLGVHFKDGKVSSFAIVSGNNPGDYLSGDWRDWRDRGSYRRECYTETARRVKELNLITIE
jgi:hypothetical protein